ncbi:MAG: LytR C-terminal domain-containing protein [Candidatus Geothermincolia bacterium]
MLALALAGTGAFFLPRLWSGEEPESTDYAFLKTPSGVSIMADEINILYLAYEDRGPNQLLTHIVVASYAREGGGAEFYDIPGTLIAHTFEGKTIQLKESLKYASGKPAQAQAEVRRLLGEELHYVVMVRESELAEARTAIGLDPQPSAEGTQAWLETDLAALAGIKQAQLTERVTPVADLFYLSPSGTPEEKASYLVDMMRAFSRMPSEQRVYRTLPAVEILNGVGTPGVGAKAQAKVESYGFSVSDASRNAKKTEDGEELNDFSYTKSKLIYYADDPRLEAAVKYLQGALAISEVELREDPSMDGKSITFIIGRDIVSKL